MAKAKSKIEIKNKRASFEYEFIESFTAGIVLSGTEIKSIREGKASLVDSYCYFVEGELFVKNMNISEYWWSSMFNRHDPRRDRKLLLKRSEIAKLSGKVNEKGLTLIPLKIYLKGSLIKLELGLCQGKKLYDKRETLKQRTQEREAQRAVKEYI